MTSTTNRLCYMLDVGAFLTMCLDRRVAPIDTIASRLCVWDGSYLVSSHHYLFSSVHSLCEVLMVMSLCEHVQTNWTLSSKAPRCLRRLSTSSTDATCTVQITVANVCKMAGDEVVLAYFKTARSEEEWSARRAGTNAEALTKSGAGPLMTPIKQLFDFSRTRDGASRVVEFELSAAAIAEVDEKTGDLVSEAASYTLMFDDGSRHTGRWSCCQRHACQRR